MSDMRDFRGTKHGMYSRLFGREYIKDYMHSLDATPYEWCLEGGFKGSAETAFYLGGRPLIRGLNAAGGPSYAYRNTEVVDGADDPEDLSKSGCFNNDFGVGLIGYIDATKGYGMLWFDNLTVVPVAGDILTGATSGATMRVSSAAVADGQGWAMGEIITVPFVVGENVTSDDAGAVMAPATVVPWRVGGEDVLEANSDTGIALKTPSGGSYTEMIIIGIRGIFETYFQGADGEPAGTGFNGVGVDGSNCTYNDDIDAYCLAGYHNTGYAVADVDTAPDNVYAYLMGTADAANTNKVPSIRPAYHVHNEPKVWVQSSAQGVEHVPQG